MVSAVVMVRAAGILMLVGASLSAAAAPVKASNPFAFASLGNQLTSHIFSRRSTCSNLAVARRAGGRPFGLSGLSMSEIPWEDPAKPDNDIGYSKLESESAKLALDFLAGTKFLGDLPMQRVIVTANVEIPEAYDLSKPTAAERSLKYEWPTDKVEDPQEELQFRSKLFEMLKKREEAAAAKSKKAALEDDKDVKLTLTFGNANGYFRRWPNQQYKINLFRVNNHAFELAPEAEEGLEEAIHDMNIVSLKAEYHAEQQLFKVSGSSADRRSQC